MFHYRLMSKTDFIDQLKELGYEVDPTRSDYVIINYVVEIGKFQGQAIKLALKVGDDFPLVPPPGPHISPQLLPLHPNNDIPHPNGAVHASDIGPEWEYWSRPFPNWEQTDRTVSAYLAYIRRLFEGI